MYHYLSFSVYAYYSDYHWNEHSKSVLIVDLVKLVEKKTLASVGLS